jgi:hypothetical protein
VIEVDATGAVCLISKAVCKCSNYSIHGQGEDMSWSKSCQDSGYKLYFKPAIYSQHVMDRDFLRMALNGELEGEE